MTGDIDGSYLSGNISSPYFSSKNTTSTGYLLESPLARFKKCCLLFYSYCVFARLGFKWKDITSPWHLVYLHFYEREQNVPIQPILSQGSYMQN